MDPILEMIFPNERIGLEPWMDGFLVQVGTSHEDTQERFKSICIYIYRDLYFLEYAEKKKEILDLEMVSK